MFTLYATKEEVFSEFPEVSKWIESAKILNTELNEEKIDYLWSYGFFHPKVQNKEEYYLDMYDKCSKMKFEERIAFELTKVRVNLTLKSGNLILSNRIPKTIIPKVIEEVVTEITKVKMLVEAEYHEDQEIKDSIPDIDKSIVSFELIKDFVKSDYPEKILEIDDILDKIANSGMDSLTDEEKDFLDKKSKEM